MSDANQDSLVAEFVSVSGSDATRAKFYLQAANWELHTALSAFFDGGDDDDMGVEETDPPVVAAPRQAPAASAAAMESEPPSRSARASRIHTINHKDDSDSSEEEGQAFYAGGSETSGQQILGPKKKNPTQDLFDSAKKQGAEVVEDRESLKGKSKKPASFQGAGFKLGSDVQPSQQIGQSIGSAPAASGQPQNVAIVFWKNGFSVGDGPLRNFNDPANKPFLDAIAQGEIPAELRSHSNGRGEVNVTMEDKREADFVAPKRKVQAFAGQGFTLGSPTPDVAGAAASPAAVAASVPPVTATAATAEPSTESPLKIDESKPVTTIQIRLADGTRLVSKFNTTNTVEDIRNVVRHARPNTGDNFNLMTTFPNKVLSDRAETVESAKLLNAVIVQRMT